MFKRIGHAAFTTEDMEKSLHFYCNVLGFEKAFEINNEAGEPWIVYIKVADLQFIELFYGGVEKKPYQNGEIGFNHICFEVEDINAVAEHLRASGVQLDVEPKQGLDLNYQCWARDPDGNRIEFMQLHPDSPHVKS